MLVCRRPPDRCWTWHRTERKERRTYMLSIRPTDHFLLNNVENLIQLGDSKICDSQVFLKKEKKLFIRRMCARFVNCCSVLVRPKWIMSKAVRRLSKVWVSFYCFVDLISEWLTAKVICEKKKNIMYSSWSMSIQIKIHNDCHCACKPWIFGRFEKLIAVMK